MAVIDGEAARMILVVDDDPDLRGAIADVLHEEGYEVHCAGHGGEALDQLRQTELGRPSLILLDLMMPEVSGWDFLALQKADPHISQIPVVLMSASSKAPASGEVPGTVDALRKPFKVEQLLQIIGKHAK
jgi:two-component system, chemotaxis family, chemotaxis protein CheY